MAVLPCPARVKGVEGINAHDAPQQRQPVWPAVAGCPPRNEEDRTNDEGAGRVSTMEATVVTVQDFVLMTTDLCF